MKDVVDQLEELAKSFATTGSGSEIRATGSKRTVRVQAATADLSGEWKAVTIGYTVPAKGMPVGALVETWRKVGEGYCAHVIHSPVADLAMAFILRADRWEYFGLAHGPACFSGDTYRVRNNPEPFRDTVARVHELVMEVLGRDLASKITT